MKRAIVIFQIEASFEIEVPIKGTEKQIENLVREAVKKEAGHLSSDITWWEVAAMPKDCNAP